jgi:hypothetical protein
MTRPTVDTDNDDPADGQPGAHSVAREWVGNPDSERRANELREAIRTGGWPPYVADPNDPDDEDEPARPLTADETVEFANLVSKRELRLSLVILRRRIAGWLDNSDTEYVAGPDMIRDVITVIDETIENAGGQERGAV